MAARFSPVGARVSAAALGVAAVLAFAAPGAAQVPVPADCARIPDDLLSPLEPLEVVVTRGPRAGVHVFLVEVADDDTERSRGLMCRRTLSPDRGMLFDFRRDGEVGFWMRNTLISLDMIFIKADGRIHRIAENTVPLSERNVPSEGAVRAVLEVPAGTARRLGLQPGDTVAHRVFQRR